jgi:hypothetical protein
MRFPSFTNVLGVPWHPGCGTKGNTLRYKHQSITLQTISRSAQRPMIMRNKGDRLPIVASQDGRNNRSCQHHRRAASSVRGLAPGPRGEGEQSSSTPRSSVRLGKKVLATQGSGQGRCETGDGSRR